MELTDTIFVLKWWLMFFVIGLIFLPLTTRIFSNFFDKGYIFSKILGMAFISYVVFVLGVLKILPFNSETILFVIGVTIVINIFIFLKVSPSRRRDLIRSSWKIFLLEEIVFLGALFFWSYIRAHEPSIHGLEKYMDFGFVNSILRSVYFPPVDMWFPPSPINYYYFGHLVTAVLTKISTIPSFVTYNLMLSTIFAFTFTGAFSIGANLTYFLIFNSKFEIFNQIKMFKNLNLKHSFQIENLKLKIFVAGFLTAFLVSLTGNLHTLYAFFKPYENENPVPFWQLVFSPNTFPNGYWYPNATRFIENTIHEFPIYSSVVSDLHGHYLDVPFVLLTIAILLSLIFNFQFSIFNQIKNFKNLHSFQISNFKFQILLISFLLAVMYMTNAWDGIIYFGLVASILLYLNLKNSYSQDVSSKTQKSIRQPTDKSQNYNLKFKIKNSLNPPSWRIKLKIFSWTFYIGIIAIISVIFSLPFNLHFKPFASGIGVLCAPDFLTNIEKIGPFLFEKDHCQRSSLWQMAILYGFFYFWAVSFIIMLFKIKNQSPIQSGTKIKNANQKSKSFKNLNFIANFKFKIENFNPTDLFILILIIFFTLLIIIPEFIYVKDIYPGHYRANTMFKLVYQAFMILSLSSGYIIMRLIAPPRWRGKRPRLLGGGHWKLGYWVIGIIGLLVVSIYPYRAINSYYGNLKTYHGLDGIKYLKDLYPTDYEAILWINKNIKGQVVILEAQGDSYTDYARISANTGLPTVLGWTVHEWLWRGSYDIPSPRIEEVQKMYESTDLEETKKLLKKHNVQLVFFGDLEQQKYPNLNEDKFKSLGKVIFENGKTRIYEIAL